jgi:hypothetical protein
MTSLSGPSRRAERSDSNGGIPAPERYGETQQIDASES